MVNGLSVALFGICDGCRHLVLRKTTKHLGVLWGELKTLVVIKQ